MSSVNADSADPQNVSAPAEHIQPEMQAAPHSRWFTTVSKQPEPAQHELSEWTEILADSVAAEHVCGDHHFSWCASEVDQSDRLTNGRRSEGEGRPRQSNVSAVTIETRVANVAHPTLSVSRISKKGIQAVLGHSYGYQKSPKRLDLTCSDDVYFLRAKIESDTSAEHLQCAREVHECALVMQGRERRRRR